MQLSKGEYARKKLFGANWKFRHLGNCSASLGKPRDAEQLPEWQNFQSAPHNH